MHLYLWEPCEEMRSLGNYSGLVIEGESEVDASKVEPFM